MNALAAIVIIVVVIAVIAAVAFALKRRSEHRLDTRRQEARDTRVYADVALLEADRQSAANERAARAEHERLAAQQQEMAASAQRSAVQDMHARADEIDPDL